MAWRNQLVNLYPFDREEYKNGLDQAISEILNMKREMHEALDDLSDEVANPPETTICTLHKQLGTLTKIELILRRLCSLL